MMNAPHIPEAAPFNHDQRSWLAGFLAGMQSRVALGDQNGQGTASAVKELHIAFGTQTGNSESLALEVAAKAKGIGLSPKVTALDDLSLEALAYIQSLLVVVSTYGEGEMPDNAALFWEAISASTTPRMEHLHFGVLALGDTGYDEFCQAGKLIDIRLEQLGARRLLPRVDCDVDYEDPAAEWMENAVPLAAEFAGESTGGEEGAATVLPAKKSGWNRKNPFSSPTVENRRLSGEGSAKEIRHFAFDLADSGIEYDAGDALGVQPENDAVLVDALLSQLNADGDAAVEGQDLPLQEMLRTRLEISTPPPALVEAVNERVEDEDLRFILENGDKESLENWLWAKDTLDLLRMGPVGLFSAEELLKLLKPLQHRAYSISSSPKAHPGEVHLTVAAVRWMYEGREHRGVCSTYLADRIQAGNEVRIFPSPNRSFRIPEDPDVPMIMVGPGTGIAPFRAFLEERKAIGARGKNWLLFGDQTRKHDYIYQDELEEMQADGILDKLDLAFSRDQAEKLYVQTRMRENAKALYRWLEEGAGFYVCGDASRMAKDVDAALHEVIQEQGGLSEDEAYAYVAEMKKSKRYLRDVY